MASETGSMESSQASTSATSMPMIALLSSNVDDYERPATSWIVNGSNIVDLFATHRHKALAMATAELFPIESTLHEILALSHILLICPNQHSDSLIVVFTCDTLESLSSTLKTEGVLGFGHECI
ncbi:hypothetical protein DM01DRAFT_1193825 [Hesseltinella vesiculosa]|uniref:Uncharacterized protein n=1 Tax=Hesseltinella vesiculosa TaxID=101127 RepID=A0A1X2G3T8_9FUNG|nr:hypothetical protein DM01DRAFT_1193825 [Hesseltinella vesiculosa]